MSPIAGSSSNPEEPTYDYTEGASPLDIDQALDNDRRSRRDSQYNSYYDENGEGSTFAGPGHTANPSSVSRMSHIELGRRSSDLRLSRRRSMESRTSYRNRRDSRDSQVSRQSIEQSNGYHEDQAESDSLFDNDAIGAASRSRQRGKSPPSPTHRASVFDNIAHLFGRAGPSNASPYRRSSVSQRSSTSRLSRRSSRSAASEHALDTEDEDEERWGYLSGEEASDNESQRSMEISRDNESITASMTYDSEPPSPTEGTQTLPLLNLDPIFGGESRIDMDTSFTLLAPPPSGPPSRQTIHIPDEDSTVRFVGYETIPWRVWLWRICCVLTFGILGLLGHWFPHLWLRWVAREKAFIDSHNGFLVVEVCFPLYYACATQTYVFLVLIQSYQSSSDQKSSLSIPYIYSIS